LQWFLVKALEAMEVTDMANQMIHTWVETNYVGWNNTKVKSNVVKLMIKAMFEKYNATAIGQPGF
jgi:hypothetical protein